VSWRKSSEPAVNTGNYSERLDAARDEESAVGALLYPALEQVVRMGIERLEKGLTIPLSVACLCS
jgi:hypothetical protein